MLVLLASLLFNIGITAGNQFSLGAYFKTVVDEGNHGISVASLIMQGNVNQLQNGENKIQNKDAGMAQWIEGKCQNGCDDKSKSAKFESVMGKNILVSK